MSTVLIVDGNPLAWRGSMMYEHLTNSAGQPTGCIYGATDNFVRGVKAVNPDAVVVAWDSGKSRWRKEMHPGYKISRDAASKTPEERAKRVSVLQQIKIVQRIFADAGLHQVMADGVEADDIIGILASGFDCLPTYDNVVLLGGDRDLYQLVRGVVCIYDPIKKAWIDDAYVKDHCEGIGPEQIIDMKALTGDSGDDVPGIAGVGPKRAADLLKKYGSVDAIFSADNKAALDKYKWSAKVLESQYVVEKAKKLVTITNCMRMDQLDETEKHALAQALWTPPVANRLALSGSLDLYNLNKILDSLDILSKPAPCYQGFEQWLSFSA